MRPEPGRLGLRAARVFDGTRAVDRPTVLLEAGRIVAVGAALPDSVPVTEVDGTLLPGLVDCHQHLCFDGNGSLEDQVVDVEDGALLARCRVAARRALEGGVTTLRDLGDRGWLTLSLREDPDLATIVAAGPPITIAGGHCWYLGGCCEPAAPALVAAVRERVERGADVVKIMATGGNLTPTVATWKSQFDRDQLRVVVEEAHRHGLPVAAHCHGIDAIRDAVAVGVDSIEHCTFIGPSGRPVFDDALLAALAASASVASVGFGRLGDGPPETLAAIWDEIVRTRQRLRDLGGAIVAGTDAGIAPAKPHDVLPHALRDFLAIGCTPAEALRAMTADAATVCGVGDRKGRLAPGYDADLVAVATDPLGGADRLEVTAVWKGGRRVPVAAAPVDGRT